MDQAVVFAPAVLPRAAVAPLAIVDHALARAKLALGLLVRELLVELRFDDELRIVRRRRARWDGTCWDGTCPTAGGRPGKKSYRDRARRRQRTTGQAGKRGGFQERPAINPRVLIPSQEPAVADLQPLLFGGFVPHLFLSTSFIFIQIGGFVFQKALSFQLSAVSFQFQPLSRLTFPR